jgi:thiol-disulfide isomerase/thioredoxin
VNSPRIDFYTRKGCHLCKEALEVLRDFQREFDFEIHLIDIAQSPDLTALYGNDIPVATLDGRRILKHRADEKLLRRVLGEVSPPRHGGS